MSSAEASSPTSAGVAAHKRLVAAAAVTLALAEMAHLTLKIGWAGSVAHWAWFALALLAAPLFALREWLLSAAAMGLLAALLWTGDAEGAVLAVSRGAFFSAFILMMMLLREGAATSRAVIEVGRYLTHQPPGRRYLATAIGAQGMGVLLNFGAMSLLAPLIQKGVRADPIVTEADARRAQIRERRQLSAMIRGFSWMLAWAPTTLTQAIIVASLPKSLDAGRMMLVGMAASVCMLAVGWMEDRLRWMATMRGARPAEGRPAPWGSLRDLGVVCLFLVAATMAIKTAVGSPTTVALMAAAPAMLLGWTFTQNLDLGARTAARAVGRRLREIMAGPLPQISRDAYTLGAAGLVGTAAAALAPVERIAEVWAFHQMDPLAFLIGAPTLILLAGQLALSPIMVVVFLGGVFAELPSLPAPPELLGVALGAGWALSLTGAPNATGALITASATGKSSFTLTWRWNGVFTLAALAALGGFFWVALRFW